MVAVIWGADNGSFFVPSGCSHFRALLLDFYFTENTTRSYFQIRFYSNHIHLQHNTSLYLIQMICMLLQSTAPHINAKLSGFSLQRRIASNTMFPRFLIMVQIIFHKIGRYAFHAIAFRITCTAQEKAPVFPRFRQLHRFSALFAFTESSNILR